MASQIALLHTPFLSEGTKPDLEGPDPMTDVVIAAWIGAQRPIAMHTTHDGPCARCGTPTALIAAAQVVSRNFTGYESWTRPTGGGLCPACAWAYRTPGLRQHAHLVRRDPAELRCLTTLDARGVLAQGAPGAGEAVVVPLRAGRKHLLPSASWGSLRVDDSHLPWTTADVMRLLAVERLRSLGFAPSVLSDVAPPYAVLRRQPRRAWPAVIADWQTLAPWRDHPVWLTLAVSVTTRRLEAAA